LCIIVDANVAHKLLPENDDNDGMLVLRKIGDGALKIAIGGKNTEELYKCGQKNQLKSWLVEQVRRGNAKMVRQEIIEKHQEHLLKKQCCVSDDEHVIALALAAKCRVLFTKDANLIKDFKNGKILKKPRGSIYSTGDHRHLLEYPPCCS